jgi:hypothetical protein
MMDEALHGAACTVANQIGSALEIGFHREADLAAMALAEIFAPHRILPR